jgi:hypothetical protein
MPPDSTHPFLRSLLSSLLLWLSLGGAAFACVEGDPTEALHYRAFYQGPLSLGERLEIARVSLRRDAWGGDQDRPLVRSSLEVTTDGYRRVQALYPLRLEYRSWFAEDCADTRMAELRRRSPDPNHQLLWFDQGLVQRFTQKPGKKAVALPVLLHSVVGETERGFAGGGKVRFDGAAGILDRLALLQRLRADPPAAGQSLELPVSDGKGLRGYRVVGEGREGPGSDSLIAGSQRLRLIPQGQEGEEPPTLVWLAEDAARTPLRFVAPRSFGNFEVRLEPGDRPRRQP